MTLLVCARCHGKGVCPADGDNEGPYSCPECEGTGEGLEPQDREAFYQEADRAREADKAADGPFKRKLARGLELEQRHQNVQDVINRRR